MALCSGTSGSFVCPNSVMEFNKIYCCGISGLQFCCDHETYNNVFTNLGTGAIIGIVIGALLLIIGLFVCCCWCCKCCCFSNRNEPTFTVVAGPNPISITPSAPPNHGYSRLAETYRGERQSIAAQ